MTDEEIAKELAKMKIEAVEIQAILATQDVPDEDLVDRLIFIMMCQRDPSYMFS